MIAFWMDDHHRTAAIAAGAIPQVELLDPCGLHVGDTISFPGFRNLAFRVKSRHYRQGAADGEAKWLLELEPGEHPF